MVREVIREGDHVHVVKGKYACHRLAVVVQCTSKCVYLRFEGCHEAKLVKQTSVVLVEDLKTLALRVQNLRIALREAEAHLARKQEMVNKEKTQTKAKAEERANDVKGPGDRVKCSEVEAHLLQNKEMVNKEKMQTKANAGRANNVMRPGNPVRITWDRVWKWNTSTRRMPRTDYEGATGTVAHTTVCFAWVVLDKKNEVVKKKKHNVTLVSS